MRLTILPIAMAVAASSLAAAQAPARPATDGMWLMRPIDPQSGTAVGMMPGPFIRAARARLDGLADFAMFGMALHRLNVAEPPADRRSLTVSEMTPGALAVVGVWPVIGRQFLDEDLNGAAVAIVTYPVWQGLFGGRPDVLGERLWRGAAGEARTPVIIVGVLPRDFFIRVPVADPGAEAFVPSRVFVNKSSVDGSFAPVLRLRAGVSIDRVRQEVGRAVDSVRAQVGDPVGQLNTRLDPADRPGWMK